MTGGGEFRRMGRVTGGRYYGPGNYARRPQLYQPANRNQRFGYGAGGVGAWRYGAAGGIAAIQQLADVGPALMQDIAGSSAVGMLVQFEFPWNYQKDATWAALQQGVYLPTGWTRCATPLWSGSCGNEPVITLWDWASTGVNPVCNPWGPCPQLQVSAFNDPLNTSVGWPNNVNQVVYSRRNPSNPTRYDFIRAYSGPGQVGNPVLPRIVTPVVPVARPMANPWIDPMPAVRFNAAPNPWSYTDPLTGRMRANPVVRPSKDFSVPRSGRPTVTKGGHPSKPDKQPTRKGGPLGAKGAMAGRLMAALRVMHGVTEFKDAVEALFDALPLWLQKDMKKKYGGDWIGKLYGVIASSGYYMNNPGTFTRAVNNLIAEGMSDAVMGRLMGSSWRDGVRNFDDNYGSTAWADGAWDAAFDNPYTQPPEVHRNY